MAAKHLDGLWLWTSQQSTMMTKFDIAAFVTTCCVWVILQYGSKLLFPEGSEIPDDFWYQVPQSQSSHKTLHLEQSLARNIARLLNEQDIDAVIFWGSQSGRAEMLARRLAKNLKTRFGLRCIAADLDDYDHKHLVEISGRKLCGFMMSTYGDGDPPDNTHRFWDALKSLQANGSRLENLSYVLFGLGNSNYRLFNKSAEDLDAMLQRLGAKRLGEAGRGDDSNGSTETDFLSWRQDMEASLVSEWDLREISHEKYQPTFKFEGIGNQDTTQAQLHLGEPAASRARLLPGQLKDTTEPSALRIHNIKRLWESPERLCLDINIDLGSMRLMKYQTGDHMAIWPSNPDHEVERIVAALGLADKRETPFTVSFCNENDYGQQLPVPSPTTIESLLRYYLEICGPLSFETVAALVEFSPSESARGFLRRVTEDAVSFKREISLYHMSLADVLDSAGGGAAWSIPPSFLLERLRPMQPRYYSISSSAMVHPRKASLAIVVNKRPRQTSLATPSALSQGCYGLATEYLCAVETSINESAKIPGVASFDLAGPRGILERSRLFSRVCRSTFKLPPKASTPVILIGAGTGVAPFRAFLQERTRQKDTLQDVGKTLLFMGFRHPDTDFIYKEDWLSFQESLGPSALGYWTAFSRESQGQKVYVQDIVGQHTDKVMELMEASFSSRIYICGSTHMARDVTRTLGQMRSRYMGEDQEQGTLWVKKLRQSNRLLEDVWS